MAIPTPDEAAQLVDDPNTTAAQLAEVAQHHPQLWPRVAEHPAVYPDLLTWMHENGLPPAEQPATEPEPAAPEANQSEPAATETTEAQQLAPESAASPAATPREPFLKRQWETRRPLMIVAMAVVAAIIVFGGGGIALAVALHPAATDASPAKKHAVVSAPSAPSATHTAAPPQATLTVPLALQDESDLSEDSVGVGPNALVLPKPTTQGQAPDTTTLNFETVGVFSDKPIEQAQVSLTVSQTGQTFDNVELAAQSDAASQPDSVALFDLETPSSGVTPASTQLEVADLQPGKTTATAVKVACDCNVDQVFLVDSAIVLYTLDNDDHPVATAFDVTTGAQLWTRAGFYPEVASGSLIVGDYGPSYPAGSELFGLNAATGAVVWTTSESAGNAYGGFGEYLGSHYAVVKVGDAEDINDPDMFEVLDLLTGKPLASLFGRFNQGSDYYTAAYDASTDTFVLTGQTTADAGIGLEVLNAKTGAVTFSVAPDQYTALDSPSVLGAADGRTWISASNQVDIFVSATGKQDPASPKVVTNSPLASTWPVLTNGSMSLVHSGSHYAVVINQNSQLTLAQVQGAATAQ